MTKIKKSSRPKTSIRRRPAASAKNKSFNKFSQLSSKSSGFIKIPDNNRSKLIMAVVLLCFGGIGSYLLGFSEAASMSLLKYEAESMSIPSGGYIQSDGLASEGKVLILNSNGTASGQFSLSSPTSQISIRSKGTACKGAAHIVAFIDSTKILSANVTSSWADYTVNKSFSAGIHNLKITFDNDLTKSGCSRDLRIDTATFYGPSSAPAALLSTDFSGPDSIITSADQYWNGGSTDPIWEGESGTMYRRNNMAWSGDTGYWRFWTKKSDFTNVKVTMDLLNTSFISTSDYPVHEWDGVKIWLRRQVINNSSSANVKPGLYVAEVNRRAGNVIIQKKCAGTDTYTVLANTPWTSNPNPVKTGQWEKVGGTVKTNSDGTVTIEVIRNGTVVLSGKDIGDNGCAPIASGKVGIRSDNTIFNVDNFVVSSL